MTIREALPIRINDPRKLPAWEVPARRIAIGKGYKPSMAQLPDGTLVMVALFWDKRPGPGPYGYYREWAGIWWSRDGGLTWTEREEAAGLIGREQWLTCTSDGVLFSSCHLLGGDVNNRDDGDYTASWLHRSADGGKSWQRVRACVDGDLRCGVPKENGSHCSRNVIELPEGTLLFGVSINYTNIAYLWKSTDRGETWDKTMRVKIHGYFDNSAGFFSEDFTYLNDSGKLLHWCRVGRLGYAEDGSSRTGMFPMNDGRPFPAGNDGIDRMIWTQSTDNGLTWSRVENFGDYGQHYPRVLKLRDGRLLLTYTQRSTFYPLGLRAILSYDDGETWDFSSDQIVIEGMTPWGQNSGGGFGNTVQLGDGTLVSCYSYGTIYTEAHVEEIEVVRWNPP